MAFFKARSGDVRLPDHGAEILRPVFSAETINVSMMLLPSERQI